MTEKSMLFPSSRPAMKIQTTDVFTEGQLQFKGQKTLIKGV